MVDIAEIAFIVLCTHLIIVVDNGCGLLIDH